MDVEHCDCLSWFSGLRESHEQDGETLPFAKGLRIETASGDPAMAIGPSCDAHGQWPVALNRQRFGCRANGGWHRAIRQGTRERARAQAFQRRIPSRSINSL
jgi:hypothetical protein